MSWLEDICFFSEARSYFFFETDEEAMIKNPQNQFPHPTLNMHQMGKEKDKQIQRKMRQVKSQEVSLFQAAGPWLP